MFENKGLVLSGTRRNYIEDLSKKDYKLESATPVSFTYSGQTIVCSSWKKLIPQVIRLFMYVHPTMDICSFTVSWTDKEQINHVGGTNFEPIIPGLYVNCNETALHFVWKIQALMEFYSIDSSEVKLIIHRPPHAEDNEVKEYFHKTNKEAFIDFMMDVYQYSEKRANIIANNVCVLNGSLSRLSLSYDDFFLFDDYYNLLNYIKKVQNEYVRKYSGLKDEKINAVKNCLSLFQSFFYARTHPMIDHGSVQTVR